jgi:hypothetical protein
VPPDFLLPAFALTLAVNAALILVAIRAMRADRTEVAVRGLDGRPAAKDRAVPIAVPSAGDATDAAVSKGSDDASDDALAPTIDPNAAPVVNAADVPLRDASAHPSAGSEPAHSGHGEPTAAGRSTASPRASAAGSPTPARNGRRRKFSMPPLEDPEKVSRSIETFLAGSDVASPPPASPAVDPDAPPVAGPAAPAPVVTVAAIQLLGSSSRSVLERTVRSTARGTDTVTVDRRGRVRVVLAGTGELAAHAYHRRIRTIVEPVLEADDPTSHVVIATATELDGAVATARRRADRRLAVALRTAAAEAGRSLDAADEVADLDDLDAPESRAAGD